MLGINSNFWSINPKGRNTWNTWVVKGQPWGKHSKWRWKQKDLRGQGLVNWKCNKIHSFSLKLRNISRRGGGQGAQINAASTSDSLPGRWSPKVCCFACWARIQIWKATIQTANVWIRCRKMGGKHGKHLDKGKNATLWAVCSKTTFGILRPCLFFLFIVFCQLPPMISKMTWCRCCNFSFDFFAAAGLHF